MPKDILFKEEARGKMLSGVKQLAKAVKSTLGPCGQNVVIDKSFGSPMVTKDGVTVAKEIDLKDPYENMGAQMVKEVASKTSDIAGDGTTTATIYAEAIFTEGLKNIAAGAKAMELKRGIEAATEAVVAELISMKTDVTSNEQVTQVGTCAANQNPAIGKQIAQAMDKVGKDGVITVEESRSLETTVELVEGMQFDKGYISPHFMTNNETLVCELEKAYVLICEQKITAIKDLVKLLEAISAKKTPLLIIAEDIEGEALATLVVNKLRGVINVCAVKAPGFGDRRKAMLEDIATLTGANAITIDLGKNLEDISIEDLGRVKKVRITKDECTLIEGAGSVEDIKSRINQIRVQIEDTTSEYDREKLEERLAKMAGGVAQINVGAATETEMKERKALVEDAVHACRAAVAEGVLPGGGVSVVRASKVIDGVIKKLRGDQKTGADIVRRALSAPLRQIAENGDNDGSIVLQKVSENKDPNYGFNAQTGEYGDLIKMGVLVPTKVERVALTNAASVAGLLLTTNCAITEQKDDKGCCNTGGGGMPGGMPGMM